MGRTTIAIHRYETTQNNYVKGLALVGLYSHQVAAVPYRAGGARSVVQRTPTFESMRASSAELTGFSQRGTPA